MYCEFSNKINDILEGEISYDLALKKINDIKIKNNNIETKVLNAKKIKIIVNDKANNKNINLPKLSLQFIKRMATNGIKIAKKYSNDIPDNFSTDDLEQIINVLMEEPPFTIVEVNSPQSDVLIYTC